ncbi:MAG: ribose-5-phosphate isomerase [Phycisphaeraceae bacterium]|nr:MAG: ribose-5-phosphate isomerase [Phycisphaeraceae bacterium]
MSRTIAIGADHRGLEAADKVAAMLGEQGDTVTLLATCAPGESCDYPDQAWRVGKAVSSGEAQFGILICGSAIGMSIAANKIPGVRAAVVHDELTADTSRSHNNSNVLCLSGDLLGHKLMQNIVKVWLNTPFEGGRHARRVDKIMAIERGESPLDS